ncbi:MAG TPA: L,D-transpeptidase [Xanthobacteraceae bacterium]|nr:L,D-transpeptidase [Xanthobacteraceae bacterium]
MPALFAFVVAVTVLSLVATVQANVLVTINKSTQRMTVSADGELLYDWPVSTGRSGRDTPSGEYRAFRMEKDHYSKEWDDAPMPHSIFFTRVGHAIHGSYETAKIGSPASAGCVRLAPENAETLFALVEEQGVLKTTVKVVGDLRIALARRPSRSAAAESDGNVAPRRRYDPPRDAGPRYNEPPRRSYAQPHGWSYPAPPPYYAPPPGYYEREPYPRYYRW